MRPMTTKEKKRPKATKAETGFLTTRRNPYHEMLIISEKIHSERKLENTNIKTQYTFNPNNSFFNTLPLVCLITEKPNAVDPRSFTSGDKGCF